MADRTVTVRLRVKTSEYRSGINDANKDTVSLGRRMTETGASADRMRKRLEAATKALPKIRIDVDSTAAERHFDSLRRELETLSGQRIGIDVSSQHALSEIQRIEHELEQLALSEPSVQVQSDIGDALAQLDGLQRELGKINGSSPTVHPEVDTADALRAIEDLRARMSDLSSRTIGVDLDAGAARAELNDIQRGLEALNRTSADPQVRVESASALADLRAISAEIQRVDGRTAHVNVNANVAGALSAIALVGAALAALPVATTIGVTATAFGAAAAGAAGFAAVAVPALGRVNDALKEQESAAGSAGAAGQSLAQKQAQAASSALSLAQAQDRVRDSQAAVREAQEKVGQAAEEAAARQEQATRRVEDAERAVADAHRATQRALEDLSRAREDARERLEDLALATERGALSEERAQLNIARAQQDLAKTNADPKASGLDKQDAELRVREAELALREIRERNGDLAKESADANAKGVEGSDEVRRAKDAVTSATQREKDSERDLGDARTAAARTAVEGQRAIAQAQAGVIKAQRDAERAAQALKVQQLQAAAALEGAGGAAGGAATKMSQLSDREKDLAKDVQGFKDKYKDWQQSLEGDVFPAISGGLDLVASQLPRISPLVRTAGASFQILEKEAAKALKDPIYDQFVFDMSTTMPGAIVGFGRIAGNTFRGVTGVFDALLPHSQDLISAIEKSSEKFADWGVQLRDSPDFHQFVSFVKTVAPEIAQLIQDVAVSAGHIVQALMPFGVGALGGLRLLADITAGMSPDQIRGIAVAVAAIYSAVKAGQAINAGLGALDNLRTKIAEAGSAAGGSKSKLGGLIGLLGAGGPWGAAIGLGIAAVSLFAQKHEEARQRVKEFTDAIREDKGVIGDNTRALAINQLETEGLLQKAKDLKVNLKDFTDAVLGDPAAIAKVNDELGKYTVTSQLAGYTTGGQAVAVTRLDDKAQDLSDAIKGTNSDLHEAVSANQRAAEATDGTTGATQDAKKALDDYQSAIDIFTGKTDLQSALANLKSKYDDVRDAVNAAGGKLDFAAGMSDKQRDATIRARQAFSGYLGDVKTIADKQAELAKRTGDSALAQDKQKLAILQAAPQLLALAGKSKDARDAVYNLGASAGLSKTQLDNAKTAIKQLRDEIAKLQSKTVTVNVVATNTAHAKSVQQQLKPRAAGGIERYAAGGVRSTPPNVTAQPTILYGEGADDEAFIPYERRYRRQATQLLSRVASDFGLMVAPAGPTIVSKATAVPATAADGSDAGVVTVNVDNLDNLTLATGYTAKVVTKAVTDAGAAASDAADQASDTIDSSAGELSSDITTLSGAIDRLSSSVDSLASAVTSAAAASSSSKSSSSSSSSKSSASKIAAGLEAVGKEALQRMGISTPMSAAQAKSLAGLVQKSAKQLLKSTPGFVEPLADGGLVTSPTMALVGEAGREVVVPVDRRVRGAQRLHQAASMLGHTVTPGLTAPRYSTGGGGTQQITVAMDERFIRRLEAVVAQARGVNVNNTIHNPVAEATSTSTNRTLQLVGNLGI